MKITAQLVVIVTALLFLPSIACAGDLDNLYSPTQKEWLEMSVFKVIKDRTDPWQRRISSIIWVKEEETTIFITLTSASGEPPLSNESEKKYIDTIKSSVGGFLEKYDWAKKMKVFVQFI